MSRLKGGNTGFPISDRRRLFQDVTVGSRRLSSRTSLEQIAAESLTRSTSDFVLPISRLRGRDCHKIK
jgi:hypothetical protein